MDPQDLRDHFRTLSTALMADACVRLGLPLRLAPRDIRPVIASSHAAGRVLPARHYGSVDIFLEAMEHAEPGDILVIDNGGRMDEACIGDLIALEAQACGLAAIIVWGCHRDTADLIQIGFPVFSLGACAAGPIRLDPREDAALATARLGTCEATRNDLVLADADGVILVAPLRVEEVLNVARTIWRTERHQAEMVKAGRTLREQLQFKEYLAVRHADPSFTFRQHLRALAKAIEE